MRRKLELLKLQIKSAFLSIPKIILGTVVTAVLVIVISTCVGIATAQDSDLRMKVAVVGKVWRKRIFCIGRFG